MDPRAPLPAHSHGRLAIAPAPGNPGAEPPAAAAYLISPQEVAPGWVMLYAGTFILRAFCAGARAFVAYPVLWVAFTIGHLNSSDARLTAALNRLSTPPRHQIRHRTMRAIAFITTGAAAVWATRLPWAAYWREREYQADAYAAKLGQAQPLTMFLDTEALEHDLPKPFPWLHDHSHPPTEHRIDRIEHLKATGRTGE